MTKTTPERTCIGCGAKKLKNELIRVRKVNERVVIDISDPTGGRGAYLCGQESCFKKAAESRAFKRSLFLTEKQIDIKALEEEFLKIIKSDDRD